MSRAYAYYNSPLAPSACVQNAFGSLSILTPLIIHVDGTAYVQFAHPPPSHRMAIARGFYSDDRRVHPLPNFVFMTCARASTGHCIIV